MPQTVATEPSTFQYVGEELGVFAHAVRWKSYFRSVLRPYLGASVLEVGAGIGGTTRVLAGGGSERWVCLEPDAGLATRLSAEIDAGRVPGPVEVVVGTTADLDVAGRFDTVLYVDVLEHIERDSEELQRAIRLVRPGGACVVLCPAHQFLFSPFDAAIGHWRRYDRSLYRELAPEGATLERVVYLDSVGLLLSLANRLFLRSGSPTLSQVRLWDRVFVPCSRVLDRVLCGRVGKSILGVWRRTKPGA